jgi:rRNA-processing protein FCF1
MKIDLSLDELTDEWGDALDLSAILRDTVEKSTRAFVKKLVQEELDKVAEPVRAIISKKASLLLQQAMDEVRDLPDTTIMDALLSRKL